jgi:hypothetical protein
MKKKKVKRNLAKQSPHARPSRHGSTAALAGNTAGDALVAPPARNITDIDEKAATTPACSNGGGCM